MHHQIMIAQAACVPYFIVLVFLFLFTDLSKEQLK